MMFQNACLQDQVAIVTGGSRGIGKAIVQQLAKEGAVVHFFYNNNHDKAQEIVADLTAKGHAIFAYQADLRDVKKCSQIVDLIYNKSEKIDILVNNAGIMQDNLLAGLEENEVSDVIDINLKGTIFITKAVIPYMMKKRSGKIVNTSSMAATKPGRGQTPYAASKGAIESFTKALAVELAPRNIRVNAISPGVVVTDMTQPIRDLAENEMRDSILLKRFAEPEEIAYAVTFLVSKYADYITGAILNVDGGVKMA